MNYHVEYYDAQNIDELTLLDNPEYLMIKEYLKPMVKNGTNYYIENVPTKLVLVRLLEYLIPISITETNQFGSHVFSMQNIYTNCVLEELEHASISKRRLTLIKLWLKILSRIMVVTKFNKTIILNNWLFSTSLHHKIPADILAFMVSSLRKSYPGYTIVVKTLNIATCVGSIKNFLKLGFRFMPSRPVYILKAGEHFNKKVRRNLKTDAQFMLEKKLNLEPSFSVANLTDQLKTFYDEIYISKYGPYNVRYNRTFFEEACSMPSVLKFFLVEDNKLKAYAFSFIKDGILSTPLLGYATEDANYYRAASFVLEDYALKQQLTDNASSGVGTFKCSRGYTKYTDYTAWYPPSCCNWFNKFMWYFIEWLSKKVGRGLLNKYNML